MSVEAIVGILVAVLGGAAALLFGKQHVEKKAVQRERDRQAATAARTEAELVRHDARIDGSTERKIVGIKAERTKAKAQLEEDLAGEPTADEVNDLIRRSKG